MAGVGEAGKGEEKKGENGMKFEIGKYYRHTMGNELSILCETEMTLYGTCFIAESNDYQCLVPVGKDEASAINWTEITKEEWMKNFS